MTDDPDGSQYAAHCEGEAMNEAMSREAVPRLKWQATYLRESGRVVIEANSRCGRLWTVQFHAGQWMGYLTGIAGERTYDTPAAAVAYCEDREKTLGMSMDIARAVSPSS